MINLKGDREMYLINDINKLLIDTHSTFYLVYNKLMNSMLKFKNFCKNILFASIFL
jgi:hypothetical protein